MTGGELDKPSASTRHGTGAGAVARRVGGETPATAASAGVAAPVGVHAQAGRRSDLRRAGAVRRPAAYRALRVRQLAALAEQYGSGSLRLTPWRNVLIPDVPGASVEALQAALEAAGLPCRAPSLASGIVACAGRAGLRVGRHGHRARCPGAQRTPQQPCRSVRTSQYSPHRGARSAVPSAARPTLRRRGRRRWRACYDLALCEARETRWTGTPARRSADPG